MMNNKKINVICILLALLFSMAGIPGYNHNPAYSQSVNDGQQVWFCPNVGSIDMLNLFTNPEQWPSARSKVDVFKFYGWPLFTFSDDGQAGANILPNLVNVDAFSKLEQWNIEIAAEGVAKTLGKYEIVDGKEVFLGCKSRIEWIAELVNWSKEVINNVQSHGGVLRYLAMDEPLHKAYPYEEDGIRLYPCRHDSIAEIADDFAEFVRQVKSSYPDVLIGDIEPYPSLRVEQLKEWILALENKGVSLPFFHLDVGMGRVADYAAHGNPVDVAADLRELKSFLATRNIAFGVIFYDGTWDSLAGKDENGRLLYNQDYSGKDYYANTIEFVQIVKTAIGKPDHSIFQSWRESWVDPGTGLSFVRQLPINLPENDLSVYSHTRLINEGLDILNSPPTGVSESPILLPEKFELQQNFPNPFNPSTTIRFTVSTTTKVTLKIIDIRGREIETLTQGKLDPGEHSVQWNANGLASGVYFYRLQAGSSTETRKLLLMK